MYDMLQNCYKRSCCCNCSMASVTHLDTVCNSSTVVYIDIDIYIPKIQKWLQRLHIEHIVSKSMRVSCKQRTCHKTKHIYARTIPLYITYKSTKYIYARTIQLFKFINITYKSTFVLRTNTVRFTTHARKLEDQKNFSKLLFVTKN